MYLKVERPHVSHRKESRPIILPLPGISCLIRQHPFSVLHLQEWIYIGMFSLVNTDIPKSTSKDVSKWTLTLVCNECNELKGCLFHLLIWDDESCKNLSHKKRHVYIIQQFLKMCIYFPSNSEFSIQFTPKLALKLSYLCMQPVSAGQCG